MQNVLNNQIFREKSLCNIVIILIMKDEGGISVTK